MNRLAKAKEIRIWLSWSDNRRLTWRLLALAGCWLFFWLIDWTVLRNGLAHGLDFVLSSLGHMSMVDFVDGQVLLVVDGVRFWIGARCTYVDLVLCISPFLWRADLSIMFNLGSLLLAFFVVQGLNLLRLIGVIWLWRVG